MEKIIFILEEKYFINLFQGLPKMEQKIISARLKVIRETFAICIL